MELVWLQDLYWSFMDPSFTLTYTAFARSSSPFRLECQGSCVTRDCLYTLNIMRITAAASTYCLHGLVKNKVEAVTADSELTGRPFLAWEV